MNEEIIWSPGVTLLDIEKQVILKAFRFFRGNKTSTSIALGISIRTLEVRLDEYKKAGENQEKENGAIRFRREQFLARQRGNPTTNEFGASVLTASPAPIANAAPASTRSMGISAGARVEPIVEVRPQPAVPMHERKEVQSVSPKPAPPSNPRKSR